MNHERRMVGREVTVCENGTSFSGVLVSTGNHGVVLEIDGQRRSFSGFATIRERVAV